MTQPAPEQRFGAYVIVRQLGVGGMGTVWEARHEKLRKRVAIKTLNANVALNPEAVARFVREGELASKIEHPHIVDITDVGVQDGIPYLVMEYLDGEAMADLIERSPNGLPVDTVVDLTLPALDALDCAHNAGIVHRDLKPDNIFLTRSRSGDVHPVVLDFGISKMEGAAGARLTQTSSVMGTPYYMSPEQARGAKHIDARSDQFALGLVLYEALSGRRAVQGESALEIIHNISMCEFVGLATLRPDLPKAVVAVVERMLRPRAAERFASLRDVGSELVPFAGARAQALWRGVFGAAASASTDAGFAGTVTGVATRPSTTLSGAAGESMAPPAPSAPRNGALWIGVAAGGVALLAVAGVVVKLVAGGPDTPETSYAATTLPVAPIAVNAAPPPAQLTALELRVRTSPATATVMLDGHEIGRGSAAMLLPRDGSPHWMEVRADGYQPHRIQFLDIAPVELIELEPLSRRHRGPVVARTSVMTSGGLVAAPAEVRAAANEAAAAQAAAAQAAAVQTGAAQAAEAQAAAARANQERANAAQAAAQAAAAQAVAAPPQPVAAAHTEPARTEPVRTERRHPDDDARTGANGSAIMR